MLKNDNVCSGFRCRAFGRIFEFSELAETYFAAWSFVESDSSDFFGPFCSVLSVDNTTRRIQHCNGIVRDEISRYSSGPGERERRQK